MGIILNSVMLLSINLSVGNVYSQLSIVLLSNVIVAISKFFVILLLVPGFRIRFSNVNSNCDSDAIVPVEKE
jgi:hypothetical protein